MFNRHLALVTALGFCTALRAQAVTADSTEQPDNPYQGIVERNVFSLKPPPPPPDPEANKPPAPKITLTGIITIGSKRALMETPPPPVKPGEQAKGKQSYILTEGQRDGEIEVLEIDDKAGSVKVNNSGTVMTLTFEKDGPKLPASSSPVPSPPGVPSPTGVIPPPGFQPQQGGSVPSFPMPSRTLRAPSAGAAAQPAGTAGMGTPGVLSLNPAGQANPLGQGQAPQIERSAEESAALYLVNQAKNEQLIQSGALMPRLPRLPFGGGQPQQQGIPFPKPPVP